MISDRAAGLIAAVHGLEISLEHCTQHLLRNIQHHFPMVFQHEHSGIIWTMQGALDRSLYESQLVLRAIASVDQVAKYVRDIDRVHWTVHMNITTHKM